MSKTGRIITATLLTIATIGLIVLGIKTKSFKPKTMVNADNEQTILFNGTTTPANFDLQLFQQNNNPLPTGKTHFIYTISFKCYAANNQYNIDITHNVNVQITQNNTNTFTGTDTLTNTFTPQQSNNLSIVFYSIVITRNTTGSTFTINYDLVRNGTTYRNQTFTMNSNNWNTANATQTFRYNQTLFNANDYSEFTTDGNYIYDGSVIIENSSPPYSGKVYLTINNIFTLSDYAAGYVVGNTEGYNSGYTNGYSAGETAGYSSGYSAGETAGYSNGYSAGETAGYNDGYNYGYGTGYNDSEAFNHPIALQPLMLNILTMPFTFISQAFDVTLWPNTAYEFNIANFIKAMIAIAAILFIIRMFTSGFSIIGNYTQTNNNRKLTKSQIELNKAKTNLANRTDPNTKTYVNKKGK